MLVALEHNIFWYVAFYSSSRSLNNCSNNASVHQNSSYMSLAKEVVAGITGVFQSENLARNIQKNKFIEIFSNNIFPIMRDLLIELSPNL